MFLCFIHKYIFVELYYKTDKKYALLGLTFKCSPLPSPEPLSCIKMRSQSLFILALILTISFSFKTRKTVDDLLATPFDLQKFKKAKGQSNSGGAIKKAYYLKPDTKGIYYSFFLFQPLTGYKYVAGGKRTIKVRLENGLEIVTYKPFGKYQYDYFDPTETLIEVIARYNDKDLPELAFVGLDTVSLKNKLGDKFLRKNDCYIYHKDKNALTFKIVNGSVSWLKYTRLKFALTKANIPSELLTGISTGT